MSPSWRERLGVALCPDRVGVVRIRRGWRPQVSERRVLEFAADTPSWQAPLAALGEWLGEHQVHGGEIQLTLADAFVRYALVPWSEGPRAEAADLARACFESLYGEAMADWNIRVDGGDYGRPRLACAVPTALIAAIEAECAKSRRRIAAMQPQFVRVANRRRRKIPGDALVLVAGTRQVVCAGRRDGAWSSIRSLALAEATPERLVAVARREKRLHGLPEAAAVFVYAPDGDLMAALRREVGAIPLAAPDADGGYPLDLALPEGVRCAR